MKKSGDHKPRAKKRYGQHFLTDRNMLRKIVRAAGVVGGEAVLEVGPGTGTLTEELLGAGARVVAVEADPELADLVEEKFSGREELEMIREDVLKVSFTGLSGERGERFKVVANLPYNISGPLIAKFLQERGAFTLIVVMLQKEVAERITSGPGTKDYGSLSVLVNLYTDARVEFAVPRGLFTPRPKVDSAVVSLRVLDSPRVDVGDEAFFRKVVRAAFGQRRKTLLNSLGALGFSRDDLKGGLVEAEVDPGRRAETLSLTEFARLARALSRISG